MSLEKRHRRLVLILVGLVSLFSMPALSATVGEIAQELTCTCGCNMVASACEGTMTCGPAETIKKQILKMLDNGKSKEEILSYFVNRYGEKILSAPTKRGFNLTAWILPFAAAIGAAGIIYLLLNNWAGRKRPAQTQVPFKQEDKAYLDKIDKELKIFEG